MGEKELKVGVFYWVRITLDPDCAEEDSEWMHEDQPARYAGKDANGEDQWHFLGCNGPSNWGFRWIGPEIKFDDKGSSANEIYKEGYEKGFSQARAEGRREGETAARAAAFEEAANLLHGFATDLSQSGSVRMVASVFASRIRALATRDGKER